MDMGQLQGALMVCAFLGCYLVVAYIVSEVKRKCLDWAYAVTKPSREAQVKSAVQSEQSVAKANADEASEKATKALRAAEGKARDAVNKLNDKNRHCDNLKSEIRELKSTLQEQYQQSGVHHQGGWRRNGQEQSRGNGVHQPMSKFGG